MHLVLCLGGAPSPPARPRSSERGGSASRHLSGAGGLAPSSPSPSGGGGAGVARALQTPGCRCPVATASAFMSFMAKAASSSSVLLRSLFMFLLVHCFMRVPA